MNKSRIVPCRGGWKLSYFVSSFFNLKVEILFAPEQPNAFRVLVFSPIDIMRETERERKCENYETLGRESLNHKDEQKFFLPSSLTFYSFK